MEKQTSQVSDRDGGPHLRWVGAESLSVSQTLSLKWLSGRYHSQVKGLRLAQESPERTISHTISVVNGMIFSLQEDAEDSR